ncbi:MAG: hypothetical protein EBY16_09610 [Gammaproteobacteria bacterium]|nr:hypothetical protein [Gammaproteobacteria bacterium]
MSIPEFKICPKCKEKKHKTEYHTRKDKGYTYLKSYCKQCSSYTKTRAEILKQQYNLCSCGNIKSKKGKTCKYCSRIDHTELLIENCKHPRRIVKRTIIRDKLIDHKCSECGITNEWNNKPIVLQLDHINGINNDNRLSNLRFLCPNCHSQTETFCGSNIKNKMPR